MTQRFHGYAVQVDWTGNRGTGTSGYRAFGRDHLLTARGKPPIQGSADPAFRGDAAAWNPEELLVASISACHKLWYLHLCAEAGISVHGYSDAAEGRMAENEDGAGRFVDVTLHPRVTIASGDDTARARSLHAIAHAKCFIANSINFPIRIVAEIQAFPEIGTAQREE